MPEQPRSTDPHDGEGRNWLSGLFVPVTTPFDPVTGDIAPVSFRENLRRWLETPINGYVVLGSTGEAALLDEDEMIQLTEWARDNAVDLEGKTALLQTAERAGARTQNGLDMLIFQGLESLKIWTNRHLVLKPQKLIDLRALLNKKLGVYD